MGGGKSSSSSSSDQDVITADNSGVTTADVILQGQEITYNTDFSADVADIFNRFIDLTADAGEGLLNLANKSLDLTAQGQERALTEVSTQTTQRENPDLAVVNKFVPVAMIGVVGFVIYSILRKK